MIAIMLFTLQLDYYQGNSRTFAVWMAVVWDVSMIVFFTAALQRRAKAIYLGSWLFGAFFVAIVMHHLSTRDKKTLALVYKSGLPYAS